MKKLYLAPLLLISSLLSNLSSANDFDVKNDWYYEGLNKPTKETTIHITNPAGEALQKIQTQFNEEGFISSITYDEDLQQIFEPYQGKTRTMKFAYEAAGEEHSQTLTTQWLQANHVRFDDGDLVIDTFYDDKGNAIRRELFLDGTETPEEMIEYQYLDNSTQPTDPTNQVVIINLEYDQYGNWVKQSEENPYDQRIIRTRTIEYFP